MDNKENEKIEVVEKDYYTKSEVENLINNKLNDNLKDLLTRFNNLQPKQEAKTEPVKRELTEKELRF